jgi:GNAT superfamily N-acetyltransferase
MAEQAVDIRRLLPGDIPAAIDEFTELVYKGERSEAERHFGGHLDGKADSFVARLGDRLAGYITVRWESEYEPFRREGIPFIHHLEVFPEFQRRGIGSGLMDAAEGMIATRSRKACICVGLWSAYGAAQRLYVKRGYVPDGRGVCDGHRPLEPGERVEIGHHLLLWFTKELKA